MMEQLTPRQDQILNFMRKQIIENGYPPTVREICKAVGLASTSSVYKYLSTLEEKEYIRRDPTKPRAIVILSDERIEKEIHEKYQLIGEIYITQVQTVNILLKLDDHIKVTTLSDEWNSLNEFIISNADLTKVPLEELKKKHTQVIDLFEQVKKL